jgi:hypothetical protein
MEAPVTPDQAPDVAPGEEGAGEATGNTQQNALD